MSADIKESTEHNLLIEVEDEIIVTFCKYNGGMEFAMPIIRNQIEKLGFDFKNPTKDNMKDLVDALVDVTEKIIDVDIAKEERKVFKKILKKLNITDPEPY